MAHQWISNWIYIFIFRIHDAIQKYIRNSQWKPLCETKRQSNIWLLRVHSFHAKLQNILLKNCFDTCVLIHRNSNSVLVFFTELCNNMMAVICFWKILLPGNSVFPRNKSNTQPYSCPAATTALALRERVRSAQLLKWQ